MRVEEEIKQIKKEIIEAILNRDNNLKQILLAKIIKCYEDVSRQEIINLDKDVIINLDDE